MSLNPLPVRSMLSIRARRSSRSLIAAALAALAVLAASTLHPADRTAAQQAAATAAKRPLTHADYDAWRAIQFQQLSNDGRLLAYALVPQDGDGEIVLRNLASGAEYRHARGRRPDPPATQTEGGEPTGPTGPGGPGRFGGGAGNQLDFTADGRFLVFTIFPTRGEVAEARKARKRPDEMPKNALGIMDTSTGQVARIERVKSFRLPEDAGGFLAYSLEAKPEARPAGAQRPEGAAPPPERGAAPAARGRASQRREYGTDLVLRNLADGSERTFADALDFSFSRDGRSLVYTVSSRQEDNNGLFAVTPGDAADAVALLKGKGKYLRTTWDDDGQQLVFLSDRDDAASKAPKFKLYHWDRKTQAAAELVSGETPGARSGLVVSERGGINFSTDGNRIFFGTAPPSEPETEEEDDTPAEEKVIVDLWHWQDDFIQPMQRVRANQTRNRSYRAVYHIREKKFVQLADETLEGLAPAGDGLRAIGSDDRPHRRLVGVDANYSDYYLVDTLTGARKPLRRKQQFGLSSSPLGRYATFFDGKDWHAVSLVNGNTVNLTKDLGVAFHREDHDTPNTPFAYAQPIWTKDDRYVLLSDRYDIWQASPDSGSARPLTDGLGRREKITFRYVRLETDNRERGVDPEKPLLLRAENETTRETGFYRDRINGGAPERLLMGPKSYSAPVKAKNADVMLFTASRFDEFPDLLVSGPDFRDVKKASNANPQQSQFLWGSAELVRFRNTDGVPLSGILIKPENFDPTKKYPLMVYIYEQLSQGLHQYQPPSPGTSINRSYYASNGYLVFMPDIIYTVGYPGESAMNCVLPAIDAVVERGFVNEQAIGIQGHSWGGYQISYMITKTNRFRAAEAGAPVANMTSAYSGIRWGTGLPRQFQYERTQSRIGGNLWEYPMRFLENSPVFRADRVATPLLMLHNDNDDAVPWYQGIEYYLALRRLDKEVYLFNYNGEFHGLRRRANQKDYTRRMQEFFDHHLKGAPKPEWMEKGIPFVDREKEKEKYRTVSDAKMKAQN
ncbi:MAG: S9 family peptidase [Acidobacteria bacterium]|nr:S9 family peptidase [Acidobacteriota bacterium]